MGLETVEYRNLRKLTVHKDRKTTSNRVAPIPQLRCTEGEACDLYEIDRLQCTRSSSKESNSDVRTSVEEDDLEWSCKASIPSEFRLGATEVICEGFSYPDDPVILKGSCGVEYSLTLTALGEQRFANRTGRRGPGPKHSHGGPDFAAILFWICFLGVLSWMIYSALFRPRSPTHPGDDDDSSNDHSPGGGDDPYRDYSEATAFDKSDNLQDSLQSDSTQPSRAAYWAAGALGSTGLLAAMRDRTRLPQAMMRQEGRVNNRASNLSTSLQSNNDSWTSSSTHESTGFGGSRRR